MFMLFCIAAVIAAYLIGSVSFAVLVSHAMGIADPRTFGSGNPGATNVLRSGSKLAAILTLLLDALKGYIPVIMAVEFFVYRGAFSLGLYAVGAVAVAAFVGHLYPLFFKFKGGKGVATALGVLMAISPWLGLAVLLTWLVVASATRYSSLASIVAAVLAPIYFALYAMFFGAYAMLAFLPIGGAILVMSVLLIYRHRQNIKNLMAGTESKIGSKKKAQGI